MIPPIEPTNTATHTPLAIPKLFTKKYDNIIKITAEPIVPNLSAISGLLLENNFTNKIPVMEQISPSEANIRGNN